MPFEQLPNLALIKISGDDAETFLQGQLSNDVRALKPGINDEVTATWHYSAYCNPKGRTLALLQLWFQDDSYFGLLPHDLVEPICQRLRMYVMRSKVVIEHIDGASIAGLFTGADTAGEEWTQLGYGSALASKLADDHRNVIAGEDSVALVIDKQRCLLVYPDDAAGRLEGLEQASAGSWHQANIAAGLPEINAESSEEFIPQMINLDVLEAINFKKGCYTGQEIVARMHYLGNLKQRMYVCDISGIDTSNSLQVGGKIYRDSELAKVAGTIVSADTNGQRALAVLRIEHAGLELFIDAQTRLSVSKSQPYSLPG